MKLQWASRTFRRLTVTGTAIAAERRRHARLRAVLLASKHVRRTDQSRTDQRDTNLRTFASL
jgi:hypothetical protein